MLAAIPAWYSPWGHLLGTTSIGVITLIVALPRLHAPTAWDYATVPLAFLFSNLVEWFVHRYFMHQRRWPFTVLYDRHTPQHHRVYRYENMAIREPREFRLVLIPAAGVLLIVLTAVPVSMLAGLAANPNVGWLFLVTSALYVVGYELSHLAYHLPESSLVYRVPFLRALREHHARHHVPRLMHKANFNVTVPLGDFLFRTRAPRD